MSLPCSISAWGCPYHACMTDECQKSNVISSGADWGKGNCKGGTKMRKNTIDTFKGWDNIVDYESDDASVVLINSKGRKVAEYVYPGFTQADFERFKKQQEEKI